jgi:MFS transporter, ACS family, tartrate transporter
MTFTSTPDVSPLDRARKKAYWRLLPILFIAYVIAFVDRANVAFAKLTMVKDLPGFDNAVIGLGAGIFFIGYFLLEIPGSVIVERWSARLWIFRIMVTWGIVASLTAFIGVPLGASEWIVGIINSGFNAKLGVPEFQFYAARFLLGLAEAGFFPGVVVFLSHWFPSRDRARALALFFMATPVAQIIAPPICAWMLKIGTTEIINGVEVHHPLVLGLKGWQWIYVAWGLPAA